MGLKLYKSFKKEEKEKEIKKEIEDMTGEEGSTIIVYEKKDNPMLRNLVSILLLMVILIGSAFAILFLTRYLATPIIP